MKENTIFETQDGSHSVLSEQYGVSYHSKYGAIQESRHVFIEAGLHYKAAQQKELAILELGFGTGLNALLTLVEAEKHHWKIHYETAEAYPISFQQAAQLNYTTVLETPHLQSIFLQLHESAWQAPQVFTPHFTFQKIQSTFQSLSYSNQFDILYFDAFAPSAQPELWEPPYST